MDGSFIFVFMLFSAFTFHVIVFHVLKNLKYNTVKTKWSMLGVSTFGLLRKTVLLINLPFRFEVSLKRSELFYKKLEEVPSVKHEYDPFVWGTGRRR